MVFASVFWVFSSTTEDDIIVDQATSQDIVDDFELGKDEVVDIKDKEINKQKLRRRIDQYKVSSMSSNSDSEKLQFQSKNVFLVHFLVQCRFVLYVISIR